MTKASDKSTDKIRDADRSREAILSAAERLFAEQGFDAVSLSQIAAAAGLSRGTPSYFFGSKERLYQAVLERAFRVREEATRQACQPLVIWADSEADTPLRTALAEAVEGYLDFLLQHPDFLKLIQREELAGAARLKAVPRESKAIKEAFGAVRAVADQRDLGSFEVNDAVLVFVSLIFSPTAQRATFMASLGRDFNDVKLRRRHVRLVVDQILHVLGASR